ncbi:MAG TPA: hypothetical protein VF984_11120 [Actinomycetota bacterium]
MAGYLLHRHHSVVGHVDELGRLAARLEPLVAGLDKAGVGL